MRFLLNSTILICVINWFALPGFAQNKAPQNLSLRVGAGNSISMKHFSKEDTSLNLPGSSFVNLQLSANLAMKDNKSIFLGLEMQKLNYYPTFNEKANLTYVSLLAGITTRADVTRAFYVKYTGGLSLGSLVNVSSSVSGYNSYSGSPAKNVNLGLFNTLQVLFSAAEKNRRVDYGLGFDVAVNGVPVFTNKSYPLYLKQNAFIQYGLSFNVNYNFITKWVNGTL